MMFSAYKLNKQGVNIQPWHTPFPIWNQSVIPRPVLTVVSWPAYRFLRRQVRWSGIPISLRIFHSLLWSTQSKALCCFFDNPVDVGNLIIAKEFNLWTVGLVHVKVSLKKSATHFLLTNISALYSSQNSVGFFCLKTHAFWNQIREIKFISRLSF